MNVPVWPWPEHRVWSWMLSRPLGEATQGGGDVLEILRVAANITPGDGESWYAAFAPLARQAETRAEEALRDGHTLTARERFLRACNYHRWSEAFLPYGDARRMDAFRSALSCFERAGPLFPAPAERVGIPFEGGILPGWFLPAPGRSQPGPAVIMLAGADVYKEALYFLGGAAALARGLSVLVYDGPGQGEMGRFHGTHIRADYAPVLRAAVDYLSARPDVDADRIGVWGRSFAGYFTPRALASEQRPRAAVILGAFYDAVEVFDVYPPLREAFRHLLGTPDLATTREALRPFTLRGLLGQVNTPTLILHGEDDFLVPVSHAHRTYEELGGEKQLVIYPSGEPGSHHCQHDVLSETLALAADWLVDRL